MENLIKKIESEKQNIEGDLTALNASTSFDESDLFGVAAIEAGFYAGITQSRPVSAANSGFNTPMRIPSASYMSPNGRFLGDVDKQLANMSPGGSPNQSALSLGGSGSHGPGSPLAREAGGSPRAYRQLRPAPPSDSTGSASTSAIFSPDQPLAPALYDPRRPPSGDELGMSPRSQPAASAAAAVASPVLGTPVHDFSTLPNYQTSPSQKAAGAGRSLT